MSSYHSEIELNESTLSIHISPETGVRLESMTISKRGGKPKSNQAIVIELRVTPLGNIAPSPFHLSIPWEKGDPNKVEVLVTEILEIEQEPMLLDLRNTHTSSRPSQRLLDPENGNAVLSNVTKSRGLTPTGKLQPKDVSGRKKPILDDE